MELWRVGVFMKKQKGFNAAAKEAGINMKSKIANFLRENHFLLVFLPFEPLHSKRHCNQN